METRLYDPSYKEEWDTFIRHSKNGTFLFFRDYMEYHKERFQDFSLMFFDEKNRLFAVLPASIQDTLVTSHAGLTFGGIISNEKMNVISMLKLFDAMLEFLSKQHVARLVYKVIPHIYHMLPAEEDLYALYHNRAILIGRNVNSVISLRERIVLTTMRKRSIKKAHVHGIVVRECFNFSEFFALAEAVLLKRHHTKPTHSSQEIGYLATKFPKHIKLFSAYKNNQMLAGTLIYESCQTVHTQYLINSDIGKTCGALDYVLDYIISEVYAKKDYFSFGTSMESDASLNQGLIMQKESFGSRTIVHDIYEIII